MVQLLAIICILHWLFISVHTQSLENLDNFNWTDPVDYPLYKFKNIRPTKDRHHEIIVTRLGQHGHRDADTKQIHLGAHFPFYGALYNYTMISKHGNIHFGHLESNGPLEYAVGPRQAGIWPHRTDPALMAPYLCSQKWNTKKNEDSGVYWHVLHRNKGTPQEQQWSADFLDQFVIDLTEFVLPILEGVAGATAFHAEAALVVTWKNVFKSGEERYSDQDLSTYQLVWTSNADHTLSYVMLNYKQLGFAADDVAGSDKRGRCQSFFNGGNVTGSVFVQPGEEQKHDPRSLAKLIRGPVKGRYYFRVDDVVQRGGCSVKQAGTVPIMIYPNIVNMLGGVSVDINGGYCWDDPSETMKLFIEERGASRGSCIRINSATARCQIPYVQDWGTKTVYYQPTGEQESKAYVGFMYFVPPGLDPMRLGISNVYAWYTNPVTLENGYLPKITWHTRNFTNPNYKQLPLTTGKHSHENLLDKHKVPLDLYVIGYKEADDKTLNKYIPKHRILAKLATFQNNPSIDKYTQDERLNYDSLSNTLEWVSGERPSDLLTYRIGYLKLTTKIPDTEIKKLLDVPHELHGLISPPVSLHWLWRVGRSDLSNGKNFSYFESGRLCQEWYNSDGRHENFVRHTELQAPCPCRLAQARIDFGRFMPHPRCSKTLRSLGCAANLGSNDCYMSAENVREHRGTSQSRTTKTHSGQVCCYDDRGFLMHTSYQPLMLTDRVTPYNPGFPERAYEFGTDPYRGEFEWARNKCQFFYWRRPSSGCQEYKPPLLGLGFGASHFVTLNGQKITFNKEGIFNLLKIPADRTKGHDEVNVQIRLERYLNRTIHIDANSKPCDYARPGMGTVITGIAVQEADSSSVQVVLRKDTRRQRYRMNVIVDGKLRYFDTMLLQRYRGVLIYGNDVRGSQSEIYVVMEKPQIGIKIQEFYAEDTKKADGLYESRGLLSFQLSVSPIYGMENLKKNEAGSLGQDNLAAGISGLIYPDQASSVEWTDTNVDSLAQYKVADLDGASTVDNPSLFQVYGDDAEAWQTKAVVEQPTYKACTETTENTNVHGPSTFEPKSYAWVKNFLDQCGPRYDAKFYENVKCTTNKDEVDSVCSGFKPCQYDYALLQFADIAGFSKREFERFKKVQGDTMQHYNSCSAMSIEYPEYLKMQGVIDPKYLEGDTITFECYSDHWLKGDSKYACQKHRENGIDVMRWNPGMQPWCRSREHEARLKWLTAIGGLLLIVLLIAAVFLCCWVFKRQHRQKQATRKASTISKNLNLHPGYDHISKENQANDIGQPIKSVENVYGDPVQLYTSPGHPDNNSSNNGKPQKMYVNSDPESRPGLTPIRDKSGHLISTV